MTFQLRDYQEECLTFTRLALDKYERVANVLPTGAGKTVVFAQMALRHLKENGAGRVLVLVHTDELVQQAYDKIRITLIGQDIFLGIVKAERDDVDAQVIVGSVQTLRSEVRRRRVSGVSLVIVDEAHHATAQSYRSIIEHYTAEYCAECVEAIDVVDDIPSYCPDAECRTMRGKAKVVGFTATLARSDDGDLSKVWQTVAYRKDILWMIRNEYLIDVRGLHVKVDDLDLRKVKKSGGDFQKDALGQALSDSMAPEVVAKALREHGPDRQTICFAPLVATAYEFEKAFLAAGFTAETVHGQLSKGERRAILARYASGETQVLCNAMVLCLDEETEILTSSGWAGIDEMTLEHEVANWDQGKVFFSRPRNVIVRQRQPEEPMYFLETPRRSIRVTGGHRMLYRTSSTGQYRKDAVQDIAGRRVKLPTNGMAEPQYRSSLTLDECRLIGFWVGDGSANRSSGGVEYTLSQSSRYPKIIQWVDDLLERVGIDYVRYDKSHYKVPHIRWSLPRGTGGKSQARRGVFHFEEYLNKDGSSRLWDLDAAQFDALLEGLWYADGNHGLAEAGRPEYFRIYAKRLEMLEQLQAIGAVRGWTSSLRKESAPREAHHAQVHRLNLTRKSEHIMGDNGPRGVIQLEQEPWREERVWCVQNDTRNIITRRRGSVTVMGNTEGFDAPTTSCVIVARPTKSKPLFQQMVGRGLRVDPERPWAEQDCLVMVVAGAEMHDLRSLVDLTEKKLQPKPEQTLLEAEDELEREEGAARAAKPMWKGPTKVKEFDPLLRASRRTWGHTAGTGARYLAAGDYYIVLQESAETPGAFDVCWMAKSAKLQGRTEYTGIPLDLAMDWGEDVADRMGGEGASILNTKGKAWRRQPPTEGQLKFAKTLKIEVGPDWRKGDIAEAIDGALASRRIDPAVTMYQEYLKIKESEGS